MQARVSFFVKGANPYQGLKTLVVQNGILKNTGGLVSCIVDQRQIAKGLHLVQVSRHELQLLQMRQGIPFQGFRGEEGNELDPRSILVVSKDSRQQAHLDTMASVEATLRALGLDFEVSAAQDLKPEKLKGKELALAVGGDGTFIDTARFISTSTPVFGIISNPETVASNNNGSWGNYMLVQAQQLEQALNLMYKGCFEYAVLNRLAVTVSNQTYLALNEVFINEQDSANTARYFVAANGITEYHHDSGLLVPTGAGSPVNSWVFNSNGIVFAASSRLLQFVSRETARFNKGGDQKVLAHGFSDAIEVTSALRHNPRISLDSGLHLPFPAEAKAQITVSDSPLNFLVFPDISRRAIEKPETVEAIEPIDPMVIGPEKIAEIDAMPICRTTPPDVKKQILFLQISKDLSKLNIFGILKTGGKPLEKKDFSLKGTITNPRLLYPTAEINTLPSGLRDIILNLYTYGRRVYDYNGVISEWVASIDENVWGASIDTIVFIYALLANNILGPGIRSIGELGTGGGMIIKAGIQFCPDLTTAYASDIVQEAIDCMFRNVSPVQGAVRLITIKGKGIKEFGKVDVFEVNPPYLPEKKVTGEVDQYRGLGLIHEVLRDGKEHLTPGGKVIINYSSCAGKEFDEWVKQYGWKKRVLFAIDVPLKINRVNEDQEWLDFMLEHGGLEVRDDNQFGYKYWHKLNVVVLIPA